MRLETPALVAFDCPSCSKQHKIKAELAGKKIKCPQSGAVVHVPTRSPPRFAPRWRLVSVVAGIAFVLLLSLMLIFWRTPAHPEAVSESWLRDAAAKVRHLESDTIDDRSGLVTDEDLRVLLGLPNLRKLNLDNAAITDAGAKEIGRVVSLVSLSLTRTGISNAGLEHLKPLVGLEELRLDGNEVSDAGLIHLQAFPQLRQLSLYQTPITDAGLVHLHPLFFLERLSLDETEVTDAGLLPLSALTNLRHLHVWRTAITKAGIEQLKKSLPHITVHS